MGQRVGSRRDKYENALRGEAPGMTAFHLDWLATQPRKVEEALERAVELACRHSVYRFNFPRRDEGYELPEEHCFDIAAELFNGDHGGGARFLGAVVAEAEKDTRWWGVIAPEEEDWCRRCRNVHPFDELNGDRVCDNCITTGH